MNKSFAFRGFCIMMDLIFEWDPEKERDNVKEHGVDFDTAARVFYDYYRKERYDIDSSDNEDRWQTIGFIDEVLFVVYTERGDVTRIISARIADPFERRIYHGDGETVGRELTPERGVGMKAQIEAAAKRPYTYDPDSPLITEEYLEAQAKKGLTYHLNK